MKQPIKVVALLSAILAVSACQQQDNSGLSRATEVPETDAQKQSYSLGHNMGKGLDSAGVEFDSAYFNAGLWDALEGEQRMTEQDMQAALMALQRATIAAQQEKAAAQAEENLQAAQEYLAQNASADGVVTTESGLQYRVIEAGDGDKPAATDIVTVHYTGRLIDGTVFDSSVDRGTPATFPLNGVIPGWTEALQLMPVGSKYELTLPPELAYGDRPAGNLITPNSLLIFDVELLDIERPAEVEADVEVDVDIDAPEAAAEG